jgi:hypothetical protein
MKTSRVTLGLVEKSDFDASEIIAGFPLPSIKRAIAWVGIMDDRDDIKNVADALGCQRPQAERVLEALERRGLVVKSAKKRQWDTTALGWQLRFQWQPPRRIEPVIDRDEETDAINEGFGTVPCSILRSKADDDVAFEEADLDVGVFIEYESPRVIEISISQPDYYDYREESSTIETSVYIGVEEAKRFAEALQSAIARAEAEMVRRATVKPKRRKPPPPAKSETPKLPDGEKAGLAAEAKRSKAALKAEAANEAKERREKSALEATLKELGAKAHA